MGEHPRRRASDRKLPARIWHGWISRSRETISPVAALWLTILSGWLFLQAHDAGQTASQAKQASGDAKAAVVRVEQVATDTANLASDTNQALCALRTDLERRVAITKGILEGEKAPQLFRGIDPKTIRQSLANQQATIKSLSDLVCDNP